MIDHTVITAHLQHTQPSPELEAPGIPSPIETPSSPSQHHSEFPEFGDVKTQYHPQSKIDPKIQSFKQYATNHPQPIIPETEPWKPFRSRLDFEVAELVLEAALNRSQTDRLIKLFHRAAEENAYDPFTLKNAKDLNELWDGASSYRTNVSGLIDTLITFSIFIITV